jgi:hypothetical protein
MMLAEVHVKAYTFQSPSPLHLMLLLPLRMPGNRRKFIAS